ncbi:MAG: hypothetical protein ACRC9K_00405 [Afipia sp.]
MRAPLQFLAARDGGATEQRSPLWLKREHTQQHSGSDVGVIDYNEAALCLHP